MKKNGIVVLSLFNGISCGKEALDRISVKVTKYYSSEIDKYAIKITEKNHPETIELGDIKNWKKWEIDWKNIDLVLAGFSCQSWSVAGYQRGSDDDRGQLAYVMMDIINHIKKVNNKFKYLLENVNMSKKFQKELNQAIGIEPVLINSSLVSAQNRKRLYWANFDFEQPQDKQLVLNDILETGFVDRDKSFCLDASYSKGGNLKQCFEKNRRQLVFDFLINEKASGLKFVEGLEKGIRLFDGKLNSRNFREGYRIYSSMGKSSTLTANTKGGKGGYTGLYTYFKFIDKKRADKILKLASMSAKERKRHLKENINIDNIAIDVDEHVFIYTNHLGQNGKLVSEKSATLVCASSAATTEVIEGELVIRKLTPIECERLQTLPDNYTECEGVSNSQRYKTLGNGWTVDVIAHILSHAEL